MKNNFRKTMSLIGPLIAGSLLAFFFYVGNAYEPAPEAMDALQSSSTVTVEETEAYYAFTPAHSSSKVGFIFYQGGKVEEAAYAPLLHRLAELGISSYAVKTPFNLAFFDIDAAADVMEAEGQIDFWYTGGHSLGGVASALFAEEQADKLAGLIFLASYPSVDLTETDLPALSIYGDRDAVLDGEAFAEGIQLLLQVEMVVLEGGNHAQFGDYGFQEGDGPAEISANKQQVLTAEAILRFIEETQP
ncbi:alpha/beta hydrolase [Atopococcus tabaci]|uniref:alpha/beta hydrolase n=1 Tax=Atopococcus tabaci TaxID=269774 RepID=UPI002409F0CD|nr:alpha/beta hydrolase [Atopococcus tabaci]